MLIGTVASKRIAHKVEPVQPVFGSYGDTEILWEEETHHLPNRPYSVIYARPGGWIGMNLLYEAKARGIPIVNTPTALLISIDRSVTAAILRGEGLPVPDFFCGYPHSVPFLPFVAKNIFDVNVSVMASATATQPDLHQQPITNVFASQESKPAPILVRTPEEQQQLPKLPIFAQEYLKSAWEYKVYGIGPKILMYRQHPTLDHADKLATRERIPPEPEMVAITQKAMRLLALELCSMDFLDDNGRVALTDVNFSPALETDPDGYPMLAEYLVTKGSM